MSEEIKETKMCPHCKEEISELCFEGTADIMGDCSLDGNKTYNCELQSDSIDNYSCPECGATVDLEDLPDFPKETSK